MTGDKKKCTYTISQIAEELDISTRTLRFYEEKGLITPERTAGNQRIYTSRNKARMKLILRGKRFGFSMDEITEMIGMSNLETNEIQQIEKSLKFGDAKLRDIRERKNELVLLEQDILATREKLIKRLAALKQSNFSNPKEDAK